MRSETNEIDNEIEKEFILAQFWASGGRVQVIF